MVSLVKDMERDAPNLRVTDTVGIHNLHAFALNRRNLPGDRDKALIVIHKVPAFCYPSAPQSVVRVVNPEI